MYTTDSPDCLLSSEFQESGPVRRSPPPQKSLLLVSLELGPATHTRRLVIAAQLTSHRVSIRSALFLSSLETPPPFTSVVTFTVPVVDLSIRQSRDTIGLIRYLAVTVSCRLFRNCGRVKI